MGFYSVIDRQAWRKLKAVSEKFSGSLNITDAQDNMVLLSAPSLMNEVIQSSYYVLNKWMGRIYIFNLKWSLKDEHNDDNIHIKSRYIGGKNQKRIHFQAKKATKIIDRLNNNQVIERISKTVDFGAVEIKFCSQEKRWSIRIRPNYGDFIWILIPPIKYCRMPSSEEIEETINMIDEISKELKS